jgi:predicted metal-dependent hydrolase
MNLDYTVKYSNRKTLRINVERDRSITVNAPEGMSADKIHNEIEKKKLWIYQKINHPQKQNENLPSKKIESGASILYLGQIYTLDVLNKDFDEIIFDGNFYISKKNIVFADKLFEDWFKARANEYIVPKAAQYAKNLGVEYKSIKISKMRYRWGSCIEGKTLNFNYQLIKAPASVIDYVILHELAHIIESGHGNNFWQIIKIQLPNYLAAKNWLKNYGNLIEEI